MIQQFQTSLGGGDYKSCIGGPGKTDWDAYGGDSNFPLGKIALAKNGILSSYKINSVISNIKVEDVSSSTTIHIANFYNSVSHTHGPNVSGTATTRPYAINPVDDITGSPYSFNLAPSVDNTGFDVSTSVEGNDAYTFNCLDAGYEIKHRIKVYVREWDTYTDYLTYISSEGVTAVPDNNGTAPLVNCEGLPGFCNDYYDYDDFVNYLTGYAPTTSATARANYFPRIKYKN